MFDFNFNFDFGISKNSFNRVETFEEFCELAGYPIPYLKQKEMAEFAFPLDPIFRIPRLILGSRGYGKTDFITILRTAYQLYLDPLFTLLLITKEAERGKEIVEEIHAILEKAGVKLKGRSKRKIYTLQSKGKEPSVKSLSVRSKGLRGLHPDMILMEDIITPDDTGEAERLRVQKLYEEALKLTANVVLIGQPVHKLDLFQKLRYLIPTLEVKHGDIPQLDIDLAAQRAAGVSEQSISASYHLKILDDMSLPFGNIKNCNYPASHCVAFIDPSFKGGDYTAIAIGGMHFANLVISGFAFKKAWYDCLEEFKFLFEFFKIRSIRFETNTLGDEPVDKMRLLGAPCDGFNSTGFKHSRIINAAFCADDILFHKLEEVDISILQEPPERLIREPQKFISEITQANQIFIDQTKSYEYRSVFDDAPDAVAGLIKYLGIVR
jgi:hypothetical protein